VAISAAHPDAFRRRQKADAIGLYKPYDRAYYVRTTSLEAGGFGSNLTKAD